MTMNFDEQNEQNELLESVLDDRRERIEERKAQRTERYEELADKHRNASKSRYQASHQLSEHIPLGQPILVGHHSEKRHRRDLHRINDNMRKSIEHGKTADYYAGRLAAMENNTAISSDDPDALEKLQAKLADCEEAQEYMKRINALVRKALKLPESERVANLAEWAEVSIAKAAGWLKPDFCGRYGFPDYKTKNNGANIRRIKQRIKEIQAQHHAIVTEGESDETEYPEIGCTLILNRTLNRVQLVFKSKPEQSIRAILKSHGFHWSPSESAWQRQLNSAGEHAAQAVIAALTR
ncbi:MAG: DUF3560 domain-containing protein [Leptolyngbya sp. Prado105]|jgi:hypothetical protein|nr:DUF3560 domain-containing protein [Leptolyngbya sp. Prado105]